MKKLIITDKIVEIIDNLNIPLSRALQTEKMLAMIWSYRKEGMFYSNEQLAKHLRCSQMTVKNITKQLKSEGLIVTKRQHNSSTIRKPSEKLLNMLGSKGHSVSFAKDTPLHSEGHPVSTIPSSKEEGNRNTKDIIALLERDVSLKRMYQTQLELGVTKEEALKKLEALLKQKNLIQV